MTTTTATTTATTAPVGDNGKPAKSFASLVMSETVKALRASNKAQYDATVSVALWLAQKQMEAIGTDAGIDPKRTNGHFRMFVKALASRGEMVFRDTQHMVDAIMAKPAGDKRNAAASEYVDKLGKGLKMTDALSRLKTYSFRLMDDLHKNHADILRDIAAKEAIGIGAEELRRTWLEFVAENYGDSFNKLTETLAKPAPTRKESDAVDSIAKRAATMSDADLTRLVAKLNAIHAERANALAEAQELLDGATDETGETETDAPVETIAAAA